MKRYNLYPGHAPWNPGTLTEQPDGEWVKWEDIKPLLTLHEIEVLDDIIGMYRQEFGATDYRYIEAANIVEKLREKI